jgi:hypothetical protein
MIGFSDFVTNSTGLFSRMIDWSSHLSFILQIHWQMNDDKILELYNISDNKIMMCKYIRFPLP